MKKCFVFAALLLSLSACTETAKPSTKKIVAKLSEVEADINKRVYTHYYVIAEDGTSTEVGRALYATVDKGELIQSCNWE